MNKKTFLIILQNKLDSYCFEYTYAVALNPLSFILNKNKNCGMKAALKSFASKRVSK